MLVPPPVASRARVRESNAVACSVCPVVVCRCAAAPSSVSSISRGHVRHASLVPSRPRPINHRLVLRGNEP